MAALTDVKALAGRYADALRHMRARQLLARPRRLVPPPLLAAGRPPATTTWRPLAAGLGADPAPQSGPQPRPEETGRFDAYGRSRPFPAPGFWTDDTDGLLFLFHLHGFSELAAYAAGPRSQQGDAFWNAVLESWLRECGSPRRPAWHPYPTSGRVIAWCAALSAGGWPDPLAKAMRAHLAAQLRFLRRSVEHDIGGNHVLRNGVALTIGGACVGDPAPGLELLRRELASQILPDGGHEERSPAYQRAILADLRDAAVVLDPVPDWLSTAIERLTAWLRALAGPDGTLPLLNDAWEGPPIEPAAPQPVRDLQSSGYVVLRHGGDQAVLDLAPVAPPHLPPHAHADVLSFVLWADGQPLVVDPGSYAYDGPDRNAFRGTAAHNTLQVDGQDQCDLWGPFRAAHMPRVTRLRLEEQRDAIVVAAEHDGYRRLPDPVTHRRTFVWIPATGLIVLDRLLAREPHDVHSRLHLAPGITHGDGRIGPYELTPLGPGGPPVSVTGRYAPYLGTAVHSEIVERAARLEPHALHGWALLRPPARAAITTNAVTVTTADGKQLDVA
jgi:Heparinase II/III-like protein/Heparinase II/III N-terminus